MSVRLSLTSNDGGSFALVTSLPPLPGSLSQTAVFGAAVGTEPYPDGSEHYALDDLLGSALTCMSWFVQFNQNFPGAAAEAKLRGNELLIAWMPMINGQVIPFADILAGSWDAYMTQFFTSCKAHIKPVTLRFCHEMNLGKFGYSVGNGGPVDTAQFIETWRYVYNLQKQVCGATSNVQMLWCITGDGAIPAEQYYPGSAFIDKLGFDAYCGFTYYGWTEPSNLVTPFYQRLKALHPSAPIWLCEVGCRETRPDETHDKATWLREFFNLRGFPRLTKVVFFNKSKEQDWRLESSPAALLAAQEFLAARPGVRQ